MDEITILLAFYSEAIIRLLVFSLSTILVLFFRYCCSNLLAKCDLDLHFFSFGATFILTITPHLFMIH